MDNLKVRNYICKWHKRPMYTGVNGFYVKNVVTYCIVYVMKKQNATTDFISRTSWPTY